MKQILIDINQLDIQKVFKKAKFIQLHLQQRDCSFISRPVTAEIQIVKNNFRAVFTQQIVLYPFDYQPEMFHVRLLDKASNLMFQYAQQLSGEKGHLQLPDRLFLFLQIQQSNRLEATLKEVSILHFSKIQLSQSVFSSFFIEVSSDCGIYRCNNDEDFQIKAFSSPASECKLNILGVTPQNILFLVQQYSLTDDAVQQIGQQVVLSANLACALHGLQCIIESAKPNPQSSSDIEENYLINLIITSDALLAYSGYQIRDYNTPFSEKHFDHGDFKKAMKLLMRNASGKSEVKLSRSIALIQCANVFNDKEIAADVQQLIFDSVKDASVYIILKNGYGLLLELGNQRIYFLAKMRSVSQAKYYSELYQYFQPIRIDSDIVSGVKAAIIDDDLQVVQELDGTAIINILAESNAQQKPLAEQISGYDMLFFGSSKFTELSISSVHEVENPDELDKEQTENNAKPAGQQSIENNKQPIASRMSQNMHQNQSQLLANNTDVIATQFINIQSQSIEQKLQYEKNRLKIIALQQELQQLQLKIKEKQQKSSILSCDFLFSQGSNSLLSPQDLDFYHRNLQVIVPEIILTQEKLALFLLEQFDTKALCIGLLNSCKEASQEQDYQQILRESKTYEKENNQLAEQLNQLLAEIKELQVRGVQLSDEQKQYIRQQVQ